MTGFTFVTTTNTQTEGANRPVVEWDKLNAHVVEAAGAGKVRSIPGVISGLIDLGEQNLEHGSEVSTATEEEEAAEMAKQTQEEIDARSGVYFADGIDQDTGKAARLRFYPRKPVQQLAVMVDFPQVLVDKGQFFGNSNPLPLRMILNGEFTLKGERVKVVGKPYNIKEMNHADKGQKAVWAFAKNNGIHKLADAAGILDDDGLFRKGNIGKLLGKIVQFQFRVWMKPAKSGDAKFFTEEIKLVGMVPEGVPLPEIPEGILHGVNLYSDNDPEAVKQLRVAVKNTQKRANNYVGSPLAAMLDAGQTHQAAPQEAPKEKVQGIAPKVQDPEAFDDDVPF